MRLRLVCMRCMCCVMCGMFWSGGCGMHGVRLIATIVCGECIVCVYCFDEVCGCYHALVIYCIYAPYAMRFVKVFCCIALHVLSVGRFVVCCTICCCMRCMCCMCAVSMMRFVARCASSFVVLGVFIRALYALRVCFALSKGLRLLAVMLLLHLVCVL